MRFVTLTGANSDDQQAQNELPWPECLTSEPETD